MQPTIDVSLREWKQAANELFQTSNRSLVDYANGQALRTVIEAVRQTKRAMASKIAHELGQIGRAVSFKARSRNSKAGLKGSFRVVRGEALLREHSLAERILGARFQKTGEWGVKGGTMAERARNLIASRMRSASFIASGWLPARRKLFSVVRQKPPGASPSFAGTRQYGRDKGSAKPAVWGGLRSLITAIVENTALLGQSQAPSKARDPRPVAEAGLAAALRIVAADMRETLAKRLQKDLGKFSAKK